MEHLNRSAVENNVNRQPRMGDRMSINLMFGSKAIEGGWFRFGGRRLRNTCKILPNQTGPIDSNPK
jgi:hypothetical protein